ncbi:MAG: flagellar hook-length control protein FliK [Burkholderiaceae bacterium]|jgi:hypothetical protein|nr:flagellar hook-length control protein FliK [Burkholderiaceae bacterium]
MELRGDATGARAVSQTSAVTHVSPVGGLRQEVASRLLQLAVGQPLPAEVVSQAEDGTTMVRVADTLVQMNLPKDAQVGEKVTLTLIAREPRLTFLFERAPSVQSTLSATARLIDNILQSLPDAKGAPLAVRSPLLPAVPAAGVAPSPDMPAQLAVALQSALDSSGLFYESHLAEWVAGSRVRESLSREPQSGFQEESRLTQAHLQKLDTLQEKTWLQTIKARLSGWVQPERRTEAVIEHQSASMIKAQLDALEQRQFIWHGECWPGQAMQWAVSDGASQHKQTADEEKSWQSELHLDFPSLGEIGASVRLDGEQVQIRLRAKSDEVVHRLHAESARLVAALEEAGARLHYFSVNDE